MDENIKISLVLIIIFGILTIISAEQILWDNDSNITIIDSWEDIDGNPLINADCSWILYNATYSINQSGSASNTNRGIVNLTISKLSVVNIYPLSLNCTKNSYNGTSSKDSIKIIDELPEGYKDRLISIKNDTTEVVEQFVDINSTLKNIQFILKVNLAKYHIEAYEVTPVANEIKRVRLIVRSNGIEGDPTIRINVPVDNEKDISLLTADSEPLNFEFKKDIFRNAYIQFGAVAEKCLVNEADYDREYYCTPSTYYLAFYKEIDPNEITIKDNTSGEMSALSLTNLFNNTPSTTKIVIINALAIGILLIIIIFILILVIIEKLRKKKPSNSEVF